MRTGVRSEPAPPGGGPPRPGVGPPSETENTHKLITCRRQRSGSTPHQNVLTIPRPREPGEKSSRDKTGWQFSTQAIVPKQDINILFQLAVVAPGITEEQMDRTTETSPCAMAAMISIPRH